MTTGLQAVLHRELKRINSERIYLWLLFILPLFAFFFFTSMFEQGKADNYAVAIYDADNSPLSRQIIRWIDATPEIEFTEQVYSLQEGKKLTSNILSRLIFTTKLKLYQKQDYLSI